MKKAYKITKEGKKELEIELKSLIGKRGDIAAKIAEAREYGDLSENAEYEVAREEQGIIETRIAEIEDILQNSEIIVKTNASKVALGSIVELKCGKKSYVYSIVGPIEADPLNGRISNKSPIGAAITGKKVGEKISISTAKGEVAYEILSIK